MPLLVRNIELELDEPEELLADRAAKRLKLPRQAIRAYGVVRRSLDARRRGGIRIVYNLELALVDGPQQERRLVRRLHRRDVEMLRRDEPSEPQPGCEPLRQRPIVIGFGPAGMFAALTLAQYGYRPIVLERGQDVVRRCRDVLEDFFRKGRFCGESNLLFGEGGAGCFSDGKLHTRVRDERVRRVLEVFYQHGAPAEVLIEGRAHIGSDRLPGITRRIRRRIESFGGEVRFGRKVEDFELHEGRLAAIRCGAERIEVGPVVLAVGQSARDTLRRLHGRGIRIAPKPFQMGLRIEHPQEFVDRWQYKALCGHERLPPAEYHVVAPGDAGEDRDVFSFCMCPGGMIVPGHESPGQIATNGASRWRRNGPMANSALVMTVEPQAAGGDVLAAMAFLERWERAAFELTGGSYALPVQRASDFLAARTSDGTLATSYPLGGRWADVRRIVPTFVCQAVCRALAMFEAKMPGFASPEALIAGPETRASSPVRIVRDPRTRASVSADNLYPVGEGAGYAGGIVSAAVDGMKTAEAIIARYAPPT